MSKDNSETGAMHSFLGGLLLTVVLVVVVPMLSAWFVEPIVQEALGDLTLGPIDASTLITAAMLLVLILFLLLLGGGKIFKKYGVIGVVGLVAAYWYLGNVWNAVIPVAVILLMVAVSWIRDK